MELSMIQAKEDKESEEISIDKPKKKVKDTESMAKLRKFEEVLKKKIDTVTYVKQEVVISIDMLQDLD